MTPSRVTVLIAALCLTPAGLLAQAKPTPPVKPPDVDRDLFVLYAVEEFYRDTRVDSPVTPPVGTSQFNRFIQTRRGLVDKLYTHLKEVPARKPLATELTTYRRLLGKAEEMNRKAQEVDAKYRGKAEDLYIKVERELKFQRNEDYAFDTLPSMVRAARSAGWGWVPDRSGRAWWFHENPAQLAFMAGYIKSLQSQVKQDRRAYELFSKAQKKETKYWETERPRMESEIKEVVATYTEALDGLRKSGTASLRQTAETMAAAKKWPADEVKLDPERPAAEITLAERPRDPFPYVWRARQVTAPTLDKPDSLDDAHDAAKQVRFVGFHMVPDEPAYRPFRALAYEVGGQVALATATAETGGYGIPTAPKKDSAAATARGCWEQYQNSTGGKLTDNMRLLHQIVMSYAYSGGTSRTTQRSSKSMTSSIRPARSGPKTRTSGTTSPGCARWSRTSGRVVRSGRPPTGGLSGVSSGHACTGSTGWARPRGRPTSPNCRRAVWR